MYYESTLYLPSPIGCLKLKLHDGILVSLSISDEFSEKEKILEDKSDNSAANKLLLALNKYFDSASPFFKLPLEAKGTDFQQAVWKELSQIPLGETCTYGDIADKINSSPRVVGNACRKNPIAIIIPCHRVVSAKGIGGYAGETGGRQINIKRWLLSHEGVVL